MGLIAVTEKLHPAKAAKQSSVLILLYLSAAFDTVNHNILLSVLSRLGVTGSAWRWFQAYLDGRSYQVSRRISTCLTDIASWMTAHHLKFNTSKTELLFIPDSSFVTYKGFDPFFHRKLPRFVPGLVREFPSTLEPSPIMLGPLTCRLTREKEEEEEEERLAVSRSLVW
ncbi:hypothetical protein P4O66_013912 [Electrophorus voltai]|uniref:Reverse transcriptase domain-containing protein n=1 Tax=Electrophorus voltai TaxID=2609070 RepID=A0AAD8Z2N2_9TELE|nr:hypothetical protein P4O66_013912 [Electrophorus voltai]